MQKSEKNRNEEKNDNRESRLKKYGARIKERLAEKDEREVRDRLQRFVGFMLTVLTTVFLSRAQLFFGTFPLCLGLICSERRHLIGIGLGILIAGFAGLPQYYIYTCIILLMVRMLAVLFPIIFSETTAEKSRELIRFKSDAVADVVADSREEGDLIGICLRKIFCEEMHSKAITAAFGGAIAGLFILIENDFSFYSLCATAILTIAAPISVIAFGGVFSEGKHVKDFYKTISIGAILFLSILGAKGGSILGMNALPFLAMLFTEV